MLRITVDQHPETIRLKLEGRVAGPWVAELIRIWAETKPELKSHMLNIDLRDTTYADAAGIGVLREMYSFGNAELVANSPWTQYLADEISRKADEER